MLSEHERRELALIEQSLVEDDRKLVDSFRTGRSGRRRSRRWMSRSLVGFGVFLSVVGLLTSADGLFMQGLLFAGGGLLWMRWQAKHPLGAATDGAASPPGPRPNGGTTPPGWFRSV